MTRAHDSKSRPLLLRIQEMGRALDPTFSTDEIQSLERMLRAMLVYDPAKRATALQVVESDWMTRWGYPSLERSEFYGNTMPKGNRQSISSLTISIHCFCAKY